MDDVLELIAPGSSASRVLTVQSIVPDVLTQASDQQKHKLKVRISALLRASGSAGTGKDRAFGAILARPALDDWSIIQSHGANWAQALLHMLSIPDRSGWAPALRTLTLLLIRVHGKADLARDVAGAKVGELGKKLIPLVGVAPLEPIVTALIQLVPRYPAQFRPSLDKLRIALQPFLSSNSRLVSKALAVLVLGEKQASDVCKARIETSLADPSTSTNLILLEELLRAAGSVGAKVPASKLLDVVDANLGSLNPDRVLATLQFIQNTLCMLQPLYHHHFDALLYALVDCADIDRRCAFQSALTAAKMLRLVGWVSQQHSQIVIKLVKKVMARYKTPVQLGATVLADFVKTPRAFETQDSNKETSILAELLVAVIISLAELPQSVRLEIDRFLLGVGGEALRLAVLYPGKFSVLPLAVHSSKMEGYESLVHPRLPPLAQHAKSYHDQDQDEYVQDNSENIEFEEHHDQGRLEEESKDVFQKAASGIPISEEESDQIEKEREIVLPEVEPLGERPTVPYAETTQQEEHSGSLKADGSETTEQLSHVKPAHQEPTSPAGKRFKPDTDDDNDDDDDDDELIIPTINMDSE